LLGGGRNLLLESAQEATLMSVSTWQTKVKPMATLSRANFHGLISAFDANPKPFNNTSTNTSTIHA
jgi:hypothetical protein